MTTITIPPEYGYVLLTTSLTAFNSFWHGARVTSYRKAAKIPYPTAYADSGHFAAASSDPSKKQALHLFNCVQRAHGNFLENQAAFLATLLVAGIDKPITATVLGLGWNLGRIVYALGYTRTDKEGGKGRLAGSFFWLAQFGLYGLTAWSGAKVAGLV
ncbi:Microsomal glutathione S-transferase 3 [Elsinoe australis]|uniref:Microsomal glutathione S-transferase 3 n=1 Tax=Elsinoe australis TaxID=40998 RepID=A0A2P7ZMH9_9PEZI|nr:Microsomal glutathione S-transferase 3 [Elsinoe australis]